MKTTGYCRSMVFMLSSLCALGCHAGEGEIDKALMTLFSQRDIDVYLQQRQTAEIAGGTYEVRAGDSLDLIIRRAFPDTALRKEVLRDAFVARNPQAFRNRNPNWLLAGSTLEIPGAEDIHSMLFVDYDAVRERFPSDTSHWVRYP